MAFTLDDYITLKSEGFSKEQIETALRQEQATQKPSVTASGIGKGLFKSTVGTIRGVGTFGQDILQATTGIKGLPVLDPETEIGKKATEQLRAKDRGEKIGVFAGEVAQFALPGGLITKGLSKLDKALDIAKLAKNAKDIKSITKTQRIMNSFVVPAAGDVGVAVSQAKGKGANNNEILTTALLTGFLSVGGHLLANKIKNTLKTENIKTLTDDALGLTAVERLKGVSIKPSDKFIRDTKIVGSLGQVLKTSDDKIASASQELNTLIKNSPDEVFRDIVVKKGEIFNQLVKDHKLLTKDKDIKKLFEGTWDKYAWRLDQEVKKGKIHDILQEQPNITGISKETLNKIRMNIDGLINDRGFKKLAEQGGKGSLNELKVLGAIRDGLSKSIKDKVKDSGKLFDDQSGWIRVRDLVERRLAKEEAKQGMSLYEPLIAVTTGVGTGNLVAGAIAGFVTKRAREAAVDPQIKLAIANVIKKASSEATPVGKLAKAMRLMPKDLPSNVVKPLVLEIVNEFFVPSEKIGR